MEMNEWDSDHIQNQKESHQAFFKQFYEERVASIIYAQKKDHKPSRGQISTSFIGRQDFVELVKEDINPFH